MQSLSATTKKTAFDVEKIRKDFPLLSKKYQGKPFIYLDSAATSQKPQAVLNRIQEFYTSENANIHRGVYKLSQEATAQYENARITVANFINASCAKPIIFTRGTTESINLVASSWGRKHIHEGDVILLTTLEHRSNIVPWQILAKEKNADIRYIPLKDDATLDLSRLGELLTPEVKIVAVAQMSNVTGTIHPVKEIIMAARRVGAKILIDGAQGICHLKTDVQDLDCDFYAFSGHKMCGPTGIGVLYGREELLDDMSPYQGGGDMIELVYENYFTCAPLPNKFEAGTPNICGAIALAEAIRYLENIGFDNIRAHEIDLTEYCIRALDEFGLVKQYGPRDIRIRGGVCSFTFENVHPHDVGTILDEEGVAIRAGHHCAQLFMRHSGIPGTNRASFYFYNTREDVDALVRALHKVTEIFKHAIK